MKFHYYRNLNKNERYATTRRHLRSVFTDFEAINFLFGLRRNFEFDSRASTMPSIKGTVVTSVSYHRDRSTNFSLFPLSIIHYSDQAADDFNSQILFNIKQWIQAQMNKPDTSILGVEQLIVEWNGKEHLVHKVRFL
ncbi:MULTISPECIES: hypothetical protein [Paenibacillus]|uniref:Uncharacterized protein n=1 Tax=Paenibacillus albilobatus TaxID=2716884 RepID=A0A919XHD2_9BACL|nr:MULTISPECIES: hypothetical protein [Paenibacillus]GIO32674.1 hypothetical protein J2TS6_38150 [Paenibacillus albilobatus]